MKRYPTRRAIAASVVLFAGILMVIYFANPLRLARGQEPLTDINSIEALRAQFNDDAGRIRLVILLNPT